MPRLFVTPREIDFFNDIAKEITKDIVGQKIYYYAVDLFRTNIDEVYDEAIDKFFDSPIEINCLVDWSPANVTTNQFGHDSIHKIKVYIQSRDMLQKEIELKEGDFFTYGMDIYEITSLVVFKNPYGQIEYTDGFELTGVQTRRDLVAQRMIGPTAEGFTDPDAVQDTFVQQRGFAENKEGKTGDVRDLVRKGALDAPIVSEPAEISDNGTTGNIGNAFYGEGDE